MRTALLLSLALLLGVFVAQQNVLAIDVDSVDYDLVEDDEPDPESDDEPIPAEVDDDAKAQDASGEWYDAEEAPGATDHDATGAQGDPSTSPPPADGSANKKRKKKGRIPIPEDPVTPLTTDELLQKYFTEACATAVIALYLLNYIYGRFSNSSLAHLWLKSTTDSGLWDEAFAATGCPDPAPAGSKPTIHCESLSLYRFHATGRQHCASFQVFLSLKPRQDLIMSVIDILNPTPDVVNVEVPMLEGSLSPCVFCICRKKDVKKMREDHKDLGDFTGKPTSCTGMPDSLTCLTDTREALDTLLSRNDDKFKGAAVMEVLTAHANMINFIKLSDCDKGPTFDLPTGTVGSSKPKRLLRMQFRLPTSKKKMDDSAVALMRMAVYLVGAVGSMKLSAKAKEVVASRREEITKVKAKEAHNARMQAAQERKLEKAVKATEDIWDKSPEEQRKMQEKEKKDQMKMMRKKGMKMSKG